MQIGAWQLTTIGGGALRLDGGTMFGIVPKPLWEKHQPADERNRIRMATNCLLLRDGRHTLLVDTGPGGKFSDRQRDVLGLEEGEPLLRSLAAHDVRPDDVDMVILTHLHFDHAGGGTRQIGEEQAVPTFPHARYLVQRVEWEAAASDAPELAGSYPAEHLVPVGEANQWKLLDGEIEILPGISTLLTPGHTAGHQSIVIRSGDVTAIYLGDLCPTSSHLPARWHMAYDVDPMETRRQKPTVLGRAADERWWVLWCHDPDQAAARITRDPKREFAVSESIVSL